MLNRPSDNGHTPFGDIYYSESPDMAHWGRHRFVMGASNGWQLTKIGAGPIPIETTEGWLLLYHGVLTSCNSFVYSFGAALLDLDQPWKVMYWAEPYLLSPQAPYELTAGVSSAAFPWATPADAETCRITIHYGGADIVIWLAFAHVDEVIAFVATHSKS
jgi:beta-1,4-mannooligosaccharide/beta-1,4-mannosyl-N-acetylglucosamine phosphorylase